MHGSLASILSCRYVSYVFNRICMTCLFLQMGFFDANGMFLEPDGELQAVQDRGAPDQVPESAPEEPGEDLKTTEQLGKRLTTQPIFIDIDSTLDPPLDISKRRARGRREC